MDIGAISLFLFIITTSSQIANSQVPASQVPADPTGGTPKAACINGADHVSTPFGTKRIDELRLGDQVAAGDDEFEPVITFLHRDPGTAADGFQFTTSNGNKVTLSDDHIIFIAPNRKSVLAKNVKLGDRFYVGRGKHQRQETVTKVDRRRMEGRYSPLTQSGVILVNDVLVSCYSHSDDHHLMHRVTQWILPITFSEGIFGSEGIVGNKEGMHWFGDVLWHVFQHWFIARK